MSNELRFKNKLVSLNNNVYNITFFSVEIEYRVDGSNVKLPELLSIGTSGRQGNVVSVLERKTERQTDRQGNRERERE